MAGNSVAEKIAAIVKEPVESLGLTLWDVRYQKEGASWYLRVYIDKEDGVDINNCVDATHLLNPIIDDSGLAPNTDYFEVCSPGVERELTRPEHLDWAKKKEIKVILIRPIDNKKELIGTLLGSDGDIKISAEGEEISLNPKDIAKIKLFDL